MLDRGAIVDPLNGPSNTGDKLQSSITLRLCQLHPLVRRLVTSRSSSPTHSTLRAISPFASSTRCVANRDDSCIAGLEALNGSPPFIGD